MYRTIHFLQSGFSTMGIIRPVRTYLTVMAMRTLCFRVSLNKVTMGNSRLKQLQTDSGVLFLCYCREHDTGDEEYQKKSNFLKYFHKGLPCFNVPQFNCEQSPHKKVLKMDRCLGPTSKTAVYSLLTLSQR